MVRKMTKIRDVLLTQKRELEKFDQKPYVPRDIELSHLDKDMIKVIIGPRRAGKSFFTIHTLMQYGSFGYVNFDDEVLVEVKDYDDIIETINSLYHNPRLLFLDEIQNLARWELFVNRLQRQGYNLVITGSNSNLLSSELATHLTGRYISTIVFPFSFKEYLRYFNKELTTSEIKAKLHDYLHTGGFPEPLVKEIGYGEYLKTLHSSVIFKDIVKRYNIRFAKPMDDLSRFLISNAGGFVSYRNLAKMVDLKSTHTIGKYLDYLEEAFLHFKLNAFSYKYREQIKSEKKVYTIDNGMIGARAFNFFPHLGVLYENMVAVELKRRELKGELEFYYYKNPQGYEVDFVVKEGMDITQMIQVSYNVDAEKTRTREIRALLHGQKKLKCDRLMVITGDYENTETFDWYGVKGEIQFMPLWKWLSEK
jgi:predicted AAA+ superfamily ATPase